MGLIEGDTRSLDYSLYKVDTGILYKRAIGVIP